MKTRLGSRLTRISSVDPESFRVKLEFSDGFAGEVDLEHVFGRPKGLAAEVLRGDMFSKCFVESGALAWPNGLELCADALRQWLLEQRKTHAA